MIGVVRSEQLIASTPSVGGCKLYFIVTSVSACDDTSCDVAALIDAINGGIYNSDGHSLDVPSHTCGSDVSNCIILGKTSIRTSCLLARVDAHLLSLDQPYHDGMDFTPLEFDVIWLKRA